MRYLRPLLVAFLTAPAWAQGIVTDLSEDAPRTRVRAPFGVRLTEHRVDIRIEDQAARTEVVQVFFNSNRRPVEGVYLFPLPEDASVSGFTLRMGDKDVVGEVLDAKRAREIYRRIVHRRQDPGLLEFAGRRLLRARLFPIPPRGETRITIRYEQVLEPTGGVLEMVYPLRSDKFAPGPVKVAGRIDVRAKAGVATLFSPSHKLDVVKKSDTHSVASFEETASPADRDLRVLYTMGRQEFGLALATHKAAGADGTFLMIVAPQVGADKAQVLPKDIVFVLDTSGSMGDRGGKKLAQAKAALAYALGRLGAGDRFNVVAFSTEARAFRDGAVPASQENVAAALEYVKGLEATGGTAIHDALLEALKLPRTEGRVPLVLFLTDGMPTIGPSDPQAILKAAEARNKARARIFVFGVGNDVNAKLLTDLADQNRGADHYVAEDENIELKVSALYDKIAFPVLSDVTLKLEGVEAYDVFPRVVGDLFKGQQLIVTGRYKKAGPHAITLSGNVGKREIQFVYEGVFADKGERDYLPRLWAVRKVGFLVGEIRRNGEKKELVDEIRRLGTRYGIVTPYTSFLVVEERELARRRDEFVMGGGEGDGGGGRVPGRTRSAELDDLEEAMDEAHRALEEGEASGRGAVEGARLEGLLKKGEGYTGVGVKTVNGKSFRYKDGTWLDADLEAFLKAHPDATPVRVEYLSEAYDKLLEDARLARYLSAGARMRFVHEGKVYEIFVKE